jgi:MFS superfamily sulfate permease-like transporter
MLIAVLALLGVDLIVIVAFVLFVFTRKIRAARTPVSWLVFDAEAVTHADSTRLEALEELTKELRRDGITLAVGRLRTRMQEEFARAGLTEAIGSQHFYPTVQSAVQAFDRPQETSA